MPVEDFEALMETMEAPSPIPPHLTAIRSAKASKTQYRPLNLDDENFGL